MPVYRVFVTYIEEKQFLIRAKTNKDARNFATGLFPYKDGGDFYLDDCSAKFVTIDLKEKILCDND